MNKSDILDIENIGKTKIQNNANKHEDLTGTKISDKYELLKRIRHGGFAEVYLAMDFESNKMLEVKACDKFIYRFYTKSEADYCIDVIFKEIYMMKAIYHPAIPRIIDIVENNRYIFVISECFEGETLEKVIRMNGAQPESLVINWAKQICDALNYLHNLNPPHIYGDLKPGNLILTPDGNIKIIDFGMMRAYMLNEMYGVYGAKGFAAPEQFCGFPIDARTDVYGLGMMMHYLVTGIDPSNPPYEIKPIRQINPELSNGLEYIISKCIEPNPDKRYQNIWDIIIAFETSDACVYALPNIRWK